MQKTSKPYDEGFGIRRNKRKQAHLCGTILNIALQRFQVTNTFQTTLRSPTCRSSCVLASLGARASRRTLRAVDASSWNRGLKASKKPVGHAVRKQLRMVKESFRQLPTQDHASTLHPGPCGDVHKTVGTDSRSPCRGTSKHIPGSPLTLNTPAYSRAVQWASEHLCMSGNEHT